LKRRPRQRKDAAHRLCTHHQHRRRKQQRGQLALPSWMPTRPQTSRGTRGRPPLTRATRDSSAAGLQGQATVIGEATWSRSQDQEPGRAIPARRQSSGAGSCPEPAEAMERRTAPGRWREEPGRRPQAAGPGRPPLQPRSSFSPSTAPERSGPPCERQEQLQLARRRRAA
jgi:hypothetical protein